MVRRIATECPNCEGTGEVCAECLAHPDVCDCPEEHELTDCDVCDGQGETFSIDHSDEHVDLDVDDDNDDDILD